MNVRITICFSSLLLALLAGGLALLPVSAAAQTNAYITDSVTTQLHDDPGLGRDIFFTLCQNYDAGGQNGKVDILYVTSLKATTVHISIYGTPPQGYPINPRQIVTFKIPLAWEVTTSGVVENKAIHVWSDNADLSAIMMSYNPYTSEGMYIIPTIGWGTQHIVAAYAGLFELTFDYASEYATIADQDSTKIINVPSTSIRGTTPTYLLHASNTPFTELLNRGQVVQYKSVKAQNCSDYDMTGTGITSNNPIGVVGASMCPNIPCDYPYCDFVTEMNQPERMWSNEYLTIPYSQRHSNNGDTFLAIPSVDNQIIYNDDPQGGADHVFTLGLPKFSPFWFNTINAPTKFHSDQPFELLQYENSSTFADGTTGDAAMTTVPSVDQYNKRIVFQTPLVAGLPYTFLNFVNIICPRSDTAYARLDGKLIFTVPGAGKVKFLDPNWVGYIVSNLAPGVHVITSDTVNGTQGKVGAYIYGYGSYDSYSWPGQLGNATYNSPDTLPPLASISGTCFCSRVKISDSRSPKDSKISEIVLDSDANMGFQLDSNYLAGTVMDSSFYDICVADSSKPAYISVSAYDSAGNHTTITSTYNPHFISFSQDSINFGTSALLDTITDTLWLRNTRPYAFKLTRLRLADTTLGFRIVSHSADSIRSGDSMKIILNFTATDLVPLQDWLLASDECFTLSAKLVGNGTAPLITTSDFNFATVMVGQKLCGSVVVINSGTSPLILTKNWRLSDTTEFSFPGASQLPDTLAAGQEASFEVCYSPIDTGLDTARLDFGTNLEPPLLHQRRDFSLLYGRATLPNGVEAIHAPDEQLSLSPNPSNGDEVVLSGTTLENGATVSLIDVLGRVVRTFHWHGGHAATLKLDGIVSGTYSVRVKSMNGKVETEKLTIAR